jgi:allophanate hydrolase subunit 1
VEPLARDGGPPTVYPRIRVCGDRAVTVEFSDRICDGAHRQVLAPARRLGGLPGLRNVVPTYCVYMLGFTPGFAFLGEVDSRLTTPRLASPRPRVAPGTVGIAGLQTAAYAIESPGGWRLVGRTPVALFRPEREPPTVFEPGMVVRFRPIDLDQYRELEEAAP